MIRGALVIAAAAAACTRTAAPGEWLPAPERPAPLPDAAAVDAAPAYAVRPRPDIVMLKDPPLAWRPFWPLDRPTPELAPYLAGAAAILAEPLAAHLAGDRAGAVAACKATPAPGAAMRAYVAAWCAYLADPERGARAISTVAATAKDRAVRAAAQRDELQMVAAAMNPDTAVKWVTRAGGTHALAAEYARQGKTAEAIALYATLGTGGVDEEACELRLSKLRLQYDADAVSALSSFALDAGLDRCGDGVQALRCEQALYTRSGRPLCVTSPVVDGPRAMMLWMVLESWSGQLDWLATADRAMLSAQVPGWDVVVRDALYNALATSGCDPAMLDRVRDLVLRAVTLRAPDPELRDYASLTPDSCRALLQPR